MVLADSTGNIWCLVSSNSHNELQVKEIAGYAVSLLRPERDAAVLPADSSTREYADFCKEILGLHKSQFIWVPSCQSCYITARDLDASSAKQIQQFTAQHKCTTDISAADHQRDASSSLDRQNISRESRFQIIPYGVTPALQQWMREHKVDLPVLCDDVRLGHKGMMHRHIRNLDKPSKLEGLNHRITVPQGYSCSTVDDLLVAFRLLGGKRAVLKPLYGKEGMGVLFVSSPEELRLYDFPLGDVVLEEALVMDKGDDGVGLSVSHVTLGQGVLGGYEKVCVGSIKFGTRSSQVPGHLAAVTEKWTSQITSLIGPQGPGYFHYASVGNNPVLLGMRIGQLSTEHLAAVFMQQHAPGASFYCWTAPLHQRNLDVWTFWARLQEQGAAFSPSQTMNKAPEDAADYEIVRKSVTALTGVWPLLFLKGSVATLLAIGTDKEQVAQLRQVAEMCLRDPLTEQTDIELISWKEDVRRIWASGPRPEYRRQTQRYNLSNRCIPLVRKGLDVIILPGGHEGTREFASFCKDVLELSSDQIIFTSGSHYNLDDDIDESIVSRLKALLVSNPADKFTLVPYAVTPNFHRWASELSEFGVSVFGESLEWIQQYGHKGILHRSMAALDQPSVVEQINPKIRVAKGYYCETTKHLLDAYKLLGVKDVVLKPVYGAAGEGIMFIHDDMELALYDFPMGGVCLEEFLQLDRADDGIVISPAVHYMEGQLLGQGLVDQIMVGTSYSGWRPSVVGKTYSLTAMKAAQDIMRAAKPQGPGGFDFLSVGGKPVLTDVNTGRFNGAHSPKLFMELYAPEQNFYVWKQKPSERLTVWQFWQRLQAAGAAFWPGKNNSRGVFPMIFLPGLSGQFIAIADSEEAAQALRPVAEECLKVAVRVRQPAITQKYSLFKRADIVRKANHKRIWCLSPLNSRFMSSFCVNQLTPLHAATLLRPGVDIVVLPGNQAVREFWGFVKATTGVTDSQVIWTSGRTNCLHTDIDSSVIDAIKAIIKSESSTTTAYKPCPEAGHKLLSEHVQSMANLQGNIEGDRLKVNSVKSGSSEAAADDYHVAANRTCSWLSPSVHVDNQSMETGSNSHSARHDAAEAQARGAHHGGLEDSSTVSCSGWIMIPDTPSTSFQKWVQPLVNEGVRVFADLPTWMSRYGHKGIMHQHITQALACKAVDAGQAGANPMEPQPTTSAETPAPPAAPVAGGCASSNSSVSDYSNVAGSSRSSTVSTPVSESPLLCTPPPLDNGLWDGLEELVYVPKGYICSSVQDLHQAYDLLQQQTSSSQVSLRPVKAGVSPGEGVLKCASKQELVYYDFPLGDVILEEDMPLDCAADGMLLLPRLPYLAGDRLGNAVVDTLMVGDQIAGYRPSCLTAEAQAQLADVSARFLTKVSPKGAGALSFGLSEGRPVLLGAQMGTFAPEHCLKLFLERWAETEDCTYFCWHHVPPKGLDVWQFWARLIAAGVAFKPGVSSSGVYPLIFLPGVMGTFIAIAQEEPDFEDVSNEIDKLRSAAVAALEPPASAADAVATLQPIGWSSEHRKIFVTGASREQRHHYLQHTLPVRSLCLARRSLDVVVLPGDHEATKEFASWASRQLGLLPEQLLLTPTSSPVLDESISSDVISDLKQLVVTSKDSWTFVPLKPTASFQAWASQFNELGVYVLASPVECRYSSKSILYKLPAAPEAPTVIEQIDPEIKVPAGYVCTSTTDLLTAYRLLTKHSSPRLRSQPGDVQPTPSHSKPVLLKPLNGLGDGEGLLVVSDEQQLLLYEFAEGQEVVLEELVLLDRAPDGIIISLVIPFAEGNLSKSYIMDEVIVGQASVGFRPSETTKRFRNKALGIAQVLVCEMTEVAMGTLVFGSVNGEPILMGVDTSGCSGIHLIRLFLEQHGLGGSCFYSWRFKPPAGVGIEQFWDHLQGKGLALELDSGKGKGVIPLYFLKDLEIHLLAVGQSSLDCCLLQDKARRSIDAAFRRQLAQAVSSGPRGGSPQPIPPLDGNSTALQPPSLVLGPPAAAMGSTANGGHVSASTGAAGSARLHGGSSGSSPSGSVTGLSPASSLVAAGLPYLGSSTAAPYSSSRALSGHPANPANRAELHSHTHVSRSRHGDRSQLIMTLLIGAEAIYGPSLLEERNLLLAGGKIVGILDDATAETLSNTMPEMAVLDCKGCIITPGFVDCHVHITGGGGEAGPASRCPASRLSEFLNAGVTCVVGLLGTDAVSRSNEELISKARALNEEGITAYTWIGNYHAPPATVTGTIQRDMCLVESALGVGELAVADHRGSQLTAVEVAKIAADARVGGMLSGKAGLVHIHVGPGASGLKILRDILSISDIPITQFHPTHMDRSEDLINQGAQWLLDGGSLDFTVRTIRARRALQQYFQSSVPLDNVTVSSDAFGSLPSYDSAGRLVKYTVADAKAILRFMRSMYFQEHWPLERILPLMTSNPARLLKLKCKGTISVGADADLLVFNHNTLKLDWVYAKGVMCKCPQWTQGGFFEKGSKIRPYDGGYDVAQTCCS